MIGQCTGQEIERIQPLNLRRAGELEKNIVLIRYRLGFVNFNGKNASQFRLRPFKIACTYAAGVIGRYHQVGAPL